MVGIASVSFPVMYGRTGGGRKAVMHALSRIVVAGVAVLALGGCSTDLTGGGGSYDVDWENYPSDLRVRIESAAASADCATLQAEFDNAEANDDAQRERVGDGNEDLMGYIDAQADEAGCHG
jgi:outer membrane biogenesis lipoprotein LolB